MDRRHQKNDALLRALFAIGALKKAPYQISMAGGAGILASIEDPSHRESLLKQIDVAVSVLGVEGIILTLHGAGSEDSRGCGGYRVAGLPDLPQELLAEELRKAEAVLHAVGITIPVRMFIITFAQDGTNLLKEVFLDPTSSPQEAILAA